MRITDTAAFSLTALRRAPLRSGMMLLAIGIGVGAVVALTGVGEAARRFVTAEFAALGTNSLIILPGKSDTSGAGMATLLIGETARDLTLGDAEAIQRSPWVTRIAPIIVGAGSASWRSRLRDVTVLGTNDNMLRIQDWTLAAGQFLPALDLEIASPVCVIGATIAAEVVAATRPVGEWLRIGDARCRVIGVLEQAGLTGAVDIDETIVVPVALAQQLFNAEGLFRIVAETRDRDTMDLARNDILRIVTERHQGIEDITVISQDAVVSTFDSIFDILTMALAAIAGISLLVAGILIMNVMLVAVSQRTNEIGLLKAVGATRGQIRLIFLAESACLAAFGSLLGMASGYGAALALGRVYPFLDFTAPAWASIAALLVALSCGILFGLMPARRAAGLDPVFALQSR